MKLKLRRIKNKLKVEHKEKYDQQARPNRRMSIWDKGQGGENNTLRQI